MKLPQLYAKSSTGKVKTWMIRTEGNEIIESWGLLGCKIQESRKKVEGKNIGRSNETTPEQQAESEAKSKWQKKIDEQYCEDQNKLVDYANAAVILPMLAQKYQERKHDIVFPCYIQPKLNGVRCIYQGGKFMSREGKEFTTLNHLVPELKKLGIDTPDGEIYIHGATFQEIVRQVKKDRGTAELEYWIYDQVNKEPFKDRNSDIKAKFQDTFKHAPHLHYVETIEVQGEDEIKKYHDKWVQEGFEGVIIRNAAGLYQVKHRSKDLQKYKEFIDEEFEIVGGHEGSGPDAGTIVFEVKTKAGKVFSVRPRGPREQRAAWFKDLKKLIGEKLTVRYQNLSEDGIPIFPVGITVRDYE